MPLSPVMPTLRYRNADRAIHFLVSALGFRVHARHEGPNGTVVHSELVRGDGIIMLSTTPDKGESEGRVQLDLGFASMYVVLNSDADVDSVHAAALGEGATEVLAPSMMPYGGRGSTFRDPEGHYWSVGGYHP